MATLRLFSATSTMILALLLLFPVSLAWISPSSSIYSRIHYKFAERLSVSVHSAIPSDPSTSRMRRQLGLEKDKQAAIVSRSVPITDEWNITVWEWEKPSAVVETYWAAEQQGLVLTSTGYPSRQKLLDPFGLVSWPGAVVAAQEILHYGHLLAGKRVLVLGAGVGIETQAAAQLGAALVHATDIHPTTLKLLEYGARQAGLHRVIKTSILDIFSVEPLPEADVIICADMLYNEHLAAQVAKRCLEARQDDTPPLILISDSQQFVHKFEQDLNDKLASIGDPPVTWLSRWLPSFTGSGVAIDEDQTYSVKARVIWIGLD